MLKCSCGNKYQDNFTREDINEYKCRDCGNFVNDPEYIDLDIEVPVMDYYYELALEVEE